MIRRVWHWLFGHSWRELSACTVSPSYPNRYLLLCKSDYYEKYGFTDLDYLCFCGAHRRHRLIGMRDIKADADIQELRRMVGLDGK